jgi:hypothetical protein
MALRTVEGTTPRVLVFAGLRKKLTRHKECTHRKIY